MPSLRQASGSILLFASTALGGCAIQSGNQLPSPWASNYPDSTPVTSGRVVRFAGHYGLTGPSPAVVFRDVNGQVSGQVLVWYRRYEPSEAGRRTPADSAAEWTRMQEAMAADRARFDSTFGCTSWGKGYQDGPAWVCRVPPKHGQPNWGAELARVDSLVAAQRAADPGVGRRGDPVTPRRPGDNPGVTRMRPRAQTCMDGGSWYISVRDTRGTREVNSPAPGGACPMPEGPAKAYDQAGWKMLREMIAAVSTGG